MYDMQKTTRVLAEVLHERTRQERKFPSQHLPDGVDFRNEIPEQRLALQEMITRIKTLELAGQQTWADILAEEYAEVLLTENLKDLREELIQVAAVAVRWVEDMDKRGDTT